MKIGLYFGSFNPIHIGHLILANYIANTQDVDQIWFVISPQNPFKEKKSLLADNHRLALVKEAIEDNPKFRASDIEFNLPTPSYTVNTLEHLREKYPNYDFSLIMGEDNLRSFHKWKNYEVILERHRIFVYPRVMTIQEARKETLDSNNLKNHSQIQFCEDAPLMKISSSYIRKAIKNGQDTKYLLSEPVWKYIDEMNFYK